MRRSPWFLAVQEDVSARCRAVQPRKGDLAGRPGTT
jgi:hypothetical protein